MEVKVAPSITTAQIEKLVIKVVENRFQEAIEEYVQKNELRVKELSLIERTIRVEEELRSLREMSQIKFEATEKRFEALLREMKAGFEAMDKRFEALQREMNARFEAVDKRFSAVQWMIGILVGIPAIAFTIIQLLKVI